jgi:hypothetical protein
MLALPTFIPTTEAGLLPCVGHHHLYDTPDTQQQAATLCNGCPVRTACDTWATQHAEWGTWAGRTDDDRGTCRTEIPDTPILSATPGPDCGTELERRRHIARRETCTVCDAARAERIAAGRVARLEEVHAGVAPRGRDGYRLHMQLGIEPCEPCRKGHAASWRAWQANHAA